MTQTGGCACGRVRYRLEGVPLFTYACHCVDCQRTTGSAFVVHLTVAEDDVEVAGETRTATLPTGSGAGYDAHFCPGCGTYILCKYHRSPAATIAVRAGTLDDTSQLVVQAHIFTRSKQPWLVLPDDVPSFDEYYERDQLWTEESLVRFRELGG